MDISEDFINLSKKYKILFDKLIEEDNLKQFLLEQKNIIKILDSLYPKEIMAFLKKYKIDKHLQQWNDLSVKFIKEIDSFKINQESIIINKDGYPEIFPVYDLSFWIEQLTEKKSYEYYIILAFLSQEENYESFQIFQMIKNN